MDMSYKKLYPELPVKTPGELIDALITTNIKCFMFQEKQVQPNISLEERARYGDLVLEMNKKRNRLMRALDVVLGFSDDIVTPKTYLENQNENDLESEF